LAGKRIAHLAARCDRPVQPLPADDGAHSRIVGEPLGIVHVLIAGEAAVDGLAQQAEQPVPTFGESGRRRGGEAEGIVQLPVVFPEGTIFFKVLQLTTKPEENPGGSTTQPPGRGYFPGAYNGADVTVKDSKRVAVPSCANGG
jgi:hypothetical protein